MSAVPVTRRRTEGARGMSKKSVAIVALVAALLGGIYYCYRNLWAVSPTVIEVREIVREAQDFRERVREHEEAVREKVTVIRGGVAEEVYSLSADGLAEAALEEIEIWCDYVGEMKSEGP